MKIKIIKIITQKNCPIEEAVWCVMGALGSIDDPNIKAWASKMCGKPISPARFKKAAKKATEVVEVSHESPEDFQQSVLEQAVIAVLNYVSGALTLCEVLEDLKTLRQWRNRHGGGGAKGFPYLWRKIEGFKEKDVKAVLKSYKSGAGTYRLRK